MRTCRPSRVRSGSYVDDLDAPIARTLRRVSRNRLGVAGAAPAQTTRVVDDWLEDADDRERPLARQLDVARVSSRNALAVGVADDLHPAGHLVQRGGDDVQRFLVRGIEVRAGRGEHV